LKNCVKKITFKVDIYLGVVGNERMANGESVELVMDILDIDGVSFLKCNKRTCTWNGGYSASGGEGVRLCGFGGCDMLERSRHDRSMYPPPKGCIHPQEVEKLVDEEKEMLGSVQEAGRGLEGLYAQQEVLNKRWRIRAVNFTYYKPEMRRKHQLRFTLCVLSCFAAFGLALSAYLFLKGRDPIWWIIFGVAILYLGLHARSDFRKARWMVKRKEYELTWEKVSEEEKASGKSELLESKVDLLGDDSIGDPSTLEYL
jgi:hypothetical protein